MKDFIYWLLREYGELGTVTCNLGVSIDFESEDEAVQVSQEEHTEKMVLLPVTLVRTYSQQMRSSSDYGNLYAQGNSLIVLERPSYEIREDDEVTLSGFTFKVVDVKHLLPENIMELVVRS